MLKTFNRVNEFVAWISGKLAAWLALILVLVSLDGVFYRFVLNQPLQWTDELAIWSMIWMVWLGSIVAMRRWDHVHIPLFLRLLPIKVRMLFITFAKLLTLICLCVILWYGIVVFQGNFHGHSPSMGMSNKWIKLAIPVGAGMMSLCLIHLIMEDIVRILRKDYVYFENYGALEFDISDTEVTSRSASGLIS